ncbi:MAG: hypothetical protein ACOYUZ_04235 [Patescibacteria group bacterium]
MRYEKIRSALIIAVIILGLAYFFLQKITCTAMIFSHLAQEVRAE